MSTVRDTWEAGYRGQGVGGGVLSSEVLECQAPGSRAGTWSVLRSAAALPAMGSAVGGHTGRNSLEGETKLLEGWVVQAGRAQMPG